MMRRRGTRVVAFASGRAQVGQTSCVVQLAAALADSGYRVLLVDQRAAPGNATEWFDLRVRYELANVIQGDRDLMQVLLPARNSLAVLPAARGLAAMARLSRADAHWIADALRAIQPAPDFILIDTDAAQDNDLLLHGVDELVVVVGAAQSSITAAYALIKRLQLAAARSEFRILVNRTRQDADVFAVFDNLAACAEQHLAVRLDFIGAFPADHCLRQAFRLRRTVLEAFPASRTALAAHALAAALASRSQTASARRDASRLLTQFFDPRRLAA